MTIIAARFPGRLAPLSSFVEGTDAALLSRVSDVSEETAARYLADVGGLAGLPHSAARGLDPHLGACVVAAVELGRRVLDAKAPPVLTIAEPEDVFEHFRARLGLLDHEEMWVLAADARNGVIAERRVAQGGIHSCAVEPGVIWRFAVECGAAGIALVHNHPSGDPEPSREDIVFTRRIAEGGAVLSIRLLDHIVIARTSFISMLRRALIS